ncbi:MAG: hypothetical protein OHK0057_02910 [Thermoflexibacter sp.]
MSEPALIIIEPTPEEKAKEEENLSEEEQEVVEDDTGYYQMLIMDYCEGKGLKTTHTESKKIKFVKKRWKYFYLYN